MIEAVIFDMDGVLIDSEPMWKEAEHAVFSSLGVNVTAELSAQTASMTTQEVTQFWYNHCPWLGKSVVEVEREVVDYVAHLILKRGTAIAGVTDVLTFFKNKGLKVGLSTNAPFNLISVVLKKLEIEDYFQAISSSEFEEKGKPDPAVYLATAERLNVDPLRCIVFEDSVSGITAARRANMTVVAVPSPREFNDHKFAIAHMKIRRLADFTERHFSNLVNGPHKMTHSF